MGALPWPQISPLSFLPLRFCFALSGAPHPQSHIAQWLLGSEQHGFEGLGGSIPESRVPSQLLEKARFSGGSPAKLRPVSGVPNLGPCLFRIWNPFLWISKGKQNWTTEAILGGSFWGDPLKQETPTCFFHFRANSCSITSFKLRYPNKKLLHACGLAQTIPVSSCSFPPTKVKHTSQQNDLATGVALKPCLVRVNCKHVAHFWFAFRFPHTT